ncbi:hypothetical protein CDL15_Pgr018684 [Punica granatum]|uniref:Ent-kaurenoic acid oxidase 2-like n=1 Tax=Punica granatum TaxID=22663 RepID=A0A218VUV3_PUNGR|nr:hypothetical protein CDL15_Pgr018684 [Punica granatum]
MVTYILYLVTTFLVLGCGFVFGFLRKVNEWMYLRKLGEKRHFLPPGDMGLPWAGKMLSFLWAFRSSDPDSMISSFISRYGRTGIYKTLLFGKPTVIVCAPETCIRALADEKDFKLGYPETTQELIGRFHDVSNAKHKRLRRLTAAPITGSESLSRYIDIVQEVITASLDEWASLDRPIEFFTEIKKAAFKVVMHVFLGSEETDDAFAEKLSLLYTDVNQGLNALGLNFPGSSFYRARKAKKELEKIIHKLVDRRISMREKNDAVDRTMDLLDLLIAEEDEDGSKLDKEEIADILHLYLLASHESTAYAMMWVMICLHENPKTLEKAREEQVQMLKRRDPTKKGLSIQEIKQMSYLSKVIDEMLRRVNIAAALYREANTDVTMNGYIIPKGWKVLASLRAVHMDPENHIEPKEFNPSRWENQRSKAGAFIPFGAGSRLERSNPKCPVVYFPAPKPKDNFQARIKRVV